MNILICYGTRPEYIKIKPLIEVLKGKISFKTLFTGQHTDLIGEHKPDYIINIKDGDNRLDSIVQSILNCDSTIFNDPNEFEPITHVLVQGDTTSALAMCLAAFHRRLQIIHLEAGLRTYNLDAPYPEEANRQLISRLSNINLCPTEHNKENLIRENCKGDCYVVGNTGLDNLINYKNSISYKNKILVTLHRRENHKVIEQYFNFIYNIATANPKYSFVIPIHPNPNVKVHKNILSGKNIKVCDPIPYNDMINILASCKFIISDSGGIQEEAAFLNKRVIICRESTEREEGVSQGFHVMCKKPQFLPGMFAYISKNYKPNEKSICPFGDGHASEKILEIFLKIF